jgi:hypothetical protein
MLFEVNSTDPLTYAGAAVLLAAVASIASYIPASLAGRCVWIRCWLSARNRRVALR